MLKYPEITLKTPKLSPNHPILGQKDVFSGYFGLYFRRIPGSMEVLPHPYVNFPVPYVISNQPLFLKISAHFLKY